MTNDEPLPTHGELIVRALDRYCDDAPARSVQRTLDRVGAIAGQHKQEAPGIRNDLGGFCSSGDRI